MTSIDDDGGFALVRADGTCGKCGHEIRGVVVRNVKSVQEADVRCAACGGITVLREFRPYYGGDPGE